MTSITETRKKKIKISCRKTFRRAFFASCLIISVWMIIGKFVFLQIGKTGTSLELWEVQKVQVPTFAVCR